MTQTLAAWLQRFLKSNWSTGRQTPSLCTVLGHVPLKDALAVGCSLLEHHDHYYVQQPPRSISLEHLLSGMPGSTRGFRVTWDIWVSQRPDPRSEQGGCTVCVRNTPAPRGSWSTVCVLRLAALAQPYEAFTWCFFLMPGGAYSSIGDFLEPPNWWVSLIKVCCSWASILLSYPAAMVGKAGFAPLVCADVIFYISPCLLPSLQMTCPVPRYLSTSC